MGFARLGFSWIGSVVFMDGLVFFMDERTVRMAFQGWIGVFPFFQRSASILSKTRVPFCNLKIQLFSIKFIIL